MNDSLREGGCLCGAVRYQLSGAPVDAGYCHCRTCQRASGAPIVAWVTYPISAFALVRGAMRRYQSTAAAERHFCPCCGSQLTFRRLEVQGQIDITVATLDEPQHLPPAYHIWTRSQIPWLRVNDDLPRHPDNGPDKLL